MNVKQNYETPVSTVISVCAEQMFAISGAGGEGGIGGGDNTRSSEPSPCSVSIW